MGKEEDEQEKAYPDLRFGPLDYDVSKLLQYLSPSQLDSLEAFRSSLPTIWPEPWQGVEKLFLSDATLCRYLRARDWHLHKAQKMLVETLKWRREYKPWAITWEDVDPELNNEGKMYRGGFDKYNRPILLMKPRYDNTGVEIRHTKVKYLVYMLEKCIRAGEENNREKITLLIDFTKHSNSAGMGMKTSLEVLRILSDHYPERLGTALMVHPSWSFSFFWKAISPFLDTVTTKKIIFIKKLDELKQWIDEDVLEVEYGGANEHKYSYEEYKHKEDTLFPPHNEDGELVILFPREKKHKHKKSKKRRMSKSSKSSIEAEEMTEEVEEETTTKSKHHKHKRDKHSDSKSEIETSGATESSRRNSVDSLKQQEILNDNHSENQEEADHDESSKKHKKKKSKSKKHLNDEEDQE